eukprot:13174779-Heterocapsa_arctica.AAC.1
MISLSRKPSAGSEASMAPGSPRYGMPEAGSKATSQGLASACAAEASLGKISGESEWGLGCSVVA